MAHKFLNGVQSYFNANNYTLLGYDSLDVVGGDLVLKRAGSEKLRIGANTAIFTGDTQAPKFIAAQGTTYANGYQLTRSGHDTYRICLGNSHGLRIVNETDSSREELAFDGAGNAEFSGRVTSTDLTVNSVDQHDESKYSAPKYHVDFDRTSSSDQYFKIISNAGIPRRIRLNISSSGDNTNTKDTYYISQSGYNMQTHIFRLPGSRYNTSKLVSVLCINPSGSTQEVWIKLLGMSSGTGTTGVTANVPVSTSSAILATATTTKPTLSTGDCELDVSATDRNDYTIMSSAGAKFGGDVTTSGNIILSGASNEIIKSNGSIRLNIDSDANQSDRIFIVSTGSNSELFRVDESGNGTFAGTVTANGTTLTGATDISGKVSKTGDTMTGNLTITHANTPRINITDTTNDVDFRIRAANSYVYIEADTDNDADSTRMLMKVDDNLVHEFLPTSQIAHVDGIYTIRRTSATGQVNLDLSTRKDHAGSGNFIAGDDVGRLNFKARDSVVTSDLTVASIITEADNTFTATDKKTRMKMQVYTGSALENVLFLDSDKSATFSGPLILPDGDLTAPSISNTGDTNTGIYWPGDHQLGFAVNGSRKMYMSETGTFFQNQTNGVEINNKLKLNSDGAANSTGAYFELHHENNNSTDVCATINLTNNAGGYASIVGGTTGVNNSGYIQFKTDNAGTQSTVLTLNHDNKSVFNGNVEITGDTTSPHSDNAFLVLRGSDGSNALRVQNSGEVVVQNNYLYAAGGGVSLYVQAGAVFRGSIQNDGGNVTVGDDLDVNGNLQVLAKGSQLGSTGYYVNSTFKDVADNCGVILGHNDTANGVGAIAGINQLAFLTYGSAWTQALLLDGSQNATFAGAINLSSNKSVAWPGGSIRAEGNTLKLVATTLIDLQDNTQIQGDLTVNGNLTVQGTTTTLNTTTVEVEDNILQLNTTQGTPDTATAATSGVSIYRGDSVTQASLIFDDSDDTWDLTNKLKVASNIYSGGNIFQIEGASPYIKGTGTGAMRIKHTAGQTMYLRPDETGALSIFEGANSQTVYMMTLSPTSNNTQNDSARLTFQTRSKKSDGTAQTRSAVIKHITTDIANNGCTLDFAGTDTAKFNMHVEIAKSTPTLKFNNLAGGGLDPILEASGSNFNIKTTSVTPLSINLSTQAVTFGGSVKVNNALIDNASVTSATTTTVVASISTSTYAAVFFDYVAYKSSNIRAGIVTACSDGTNVSFSETSTTDLGDTSDVTLSVDISGGNFRLLATTTSSTWNVKSLIRAI